MGSEDFKKLVEHRCVSISPNGTFNMVCECLDKMHYLVKYKDNMIHDYLQIIFSENILFIKSNKYLYIHFTPLYITCHTRNIYLVLAIVFVQSITPNNNELSELVTGILLFNTFSNVYLGNASK